MLILRIRVRMGDGTILGNQGHYLLNLLGNICWIFKDRYLIYFTSLMRWRTWWVVQFTHPSFSESLFEQFCLIGWTGCVTPCHFVSVFIFIRTQSFAIVGMLWVCRVCILCNENLWDDFEHSFEILKISQDCQAKLILPIRPQVNLPFIHSIYKI